MPSVDLQFVRHRQREIRRAIRRSSPMLVFSGEVGIILIAPNKSTVRNRVGKILDRMAIVSRGELTACDLAHSVAAGEAYSIAHTMSRGDVLGHEPAQAVCALLRRHYHTFLGEPVAVESCLVQLNEAPRKDYLAYINYEGGLRLFDRILYLGPLGAETGDDASDHDAEVSDHKAQERLDEVNARLAESCPEYPDVAALAADLGRHTELSPLFTSGRSRDVVVLRRRALHDRAFADIFERLTL